MNLFLKKYLQIKKLNWCAANNLKHFGEPFAADSNFSKVTYYRA